MTRKERNVLALVPDWFNRRITVNLENGVMEVPVFSTIFGLKPGRCSAYVRKIASELFGLEYTQSDAWNRIYSDHLVARVNGFSDVQRMIESHEMLPGMLMGVNLPNKDSFGLIDNHGETALFRHVMIYLGRGRETGIPKFAHQEGKKTHVDSLDYLADEHYKPKAIIKVNQ